jgi:hypothetical protein
VTTGEQVVVHRTTAEIEAALAAAGPSPRQSGRLEMIVRRPQVDQREIVEQGALDLVEGLVGDSWRARGSRSMADGSANPAAQVTLMNSRIIAALAPARAQWTPAGDQLFVDLDLSEENLPAGARLALGTAVVEISALPHTGCAKFTERYGHDAIRFINSPEGRLARRRGVNARVVVPGAFRVGDMVERLDD